MYEDLFQFFGLREDPFHVSPDPHYYFATKSHASAFKELTAGIESRRGLFVLTGEAGTGKTTLVRHFLDCLEARHQSSCYIFHAQVRPMELLELILQDFGIPCVSRVKHEMVVALNKWLVQRRRMGDAPVLIIDEAQVSPLRTLRRLNVLLNLELDGCKLLQVVLAGQPELDAKLQRPELWQLQQRIIFRSRLMPLSLEETAEYVRSRLEKAGAQAEVFCEEALQAVHTGARGIPRVVNLLCEHALIAAYPEKIKPITAAIVRDVATDFDISVQTGVPSSEDMKLRPEWTAPAHMEEISSSRPQSDALISTETQEQVVPKIPLPGPSPSKWPVHVQNVAPQENAASARDAQKVAPVAVIESAAPSGRPAEVAMKLPHVTATVVSASTASAIAPAVSDGKVQAAAAVVHATAVSKMASTAPAVAARPLEVPRPTEVASVPLAMAASATALSPTPVLAPEPAKQAQGAPAEIKGTPPIEKPAKAAIPSAPPKAPIAQPKPRAVVTKPLTPKPALAKPVKQVIAKVAKPERVPIQWKLPAFAENCLGYCRAVGKSFIADWKQFLQAPIQARKQTGVGSGND
jgi:type II secretory pathway predicted ATPase ExeA